MQDPDACDRTPRERANLAARWRLGSVVVEPTTELAARVFDVSKPLVDAAIGVDTTTSPKTITATRMGRSVGLNTAAAGISRASNSKNFKSTKVVNTNGAC